LGHNTDVAGSRVVVTYTGAGRPAEQMREITIANGLSAQSDRWAHFGLGAHAGPVAVRVAWCGGPPVDYGALPADRYHVLRQAG
jgi:hypothetical protein